MALRLVVSRRDRPSVDETDDSTSAAEAFAFGVLYVGGIVVGAVLWWIL